ncbi:MAG: ABC transporter substrate-binding protein [Thermodesulfobacteriota bacterium]
MALAAAFLVSLAGSAISAEKVIRWGVAAPLQKEAGIGSKNATIMAAREINAKGGILGHKVEVFFADDEARPEAGIQAVKKLIFQDKVDFISGGWLSGVGLAQADHIFNAKKLWLSVGPATPKLAQMVKSNYDRAKYFFRVGCVNSDYFAYDMAVFAEEFYKKKLGLTKIALMAESSVWAREMATYLKTAFNKKGMQIVYMDVFDPKRTDFSPQFAKIRRSGAQVLFTVQAASPGVPLTKQWAETQLPVHQAGYSLSSQVFNFWDKTGGKCYTEVTQLINGGRAPLSPGTIPFYDNYVKEFDQCPPYTAFGSYDALYLLKYVAEQIKSLDTDKLIKALEKVDYQGVAGRIRFTKDHEEVYGEEGKLPVWIQWQGARKMEVIFPFKYATGKYITPPWIKKK